MDVTQAAREAAADYARDWNGARHETVQAIRRGEHDRWSIVKTFARFEAEVRLAAEAEARKREAVLVEEAEDRAWREARELVRGTNADLCSTAPAAYRIIFDGINAAVNDRQLRTLSGRVDALRAAHRAEGEGHD